MSIDDAVKAPAERVVTALSDSGDSAPVGPSAPIDVPTFLEVSVSANTVRNYRGNGGRFAAIDTLTATAVWDASEMR